MKHGKKAYLIEVQAIALFIAAAAVACTQWTDYRTEGVYAAAVEGTEDTQSESNATQTEATEASTQGSGEGEVGEGDNVKVGTAFGTVTGEVEDIEGDFILTYTFYNKSNGTENWDNFVVEVRNDNYTWFDVRADNYGWLWTAADGFITGSGITYGNGASNWDTWADLMREGQECTVYVIRQGTTVTVITHAAGDTFYATTTQDDYADGCDMYVHLTGESCSIEDVKWTLDKVTAWDDETLAWIENLKSLSNSNNEGGATSSDSVTMDGTTLDSTAWWSGVTGVELSSDSEYAVWNYTILVKSDISDFGIEVYNESLSKYITTLTNGEGWYAGTEGNDIVISGTSVSDDLENNTFYYVTVERQGDDFTVYYKDASGNILLAFFATDTDMDAKAFVHFYAEFGTFIVAATVEEGSAPVETEETGETETTEIVVGTEEETEVIIEETEETEEVEENLSNNDDDDDDDDYEIEDLDAGDEDTETEDTEDDIVVTISEATYSSTEWWSGVYGSESSWNGDAVWVYAVTLDKAYGDDAFSVEVYDGNGNYITMNSDGTAWYYGTTGEEIAVSGGPITLEEGMTYVVVVIRDGADFWAIFYDEDGNELMTIYAEGTDIADEAAVHFYAQIGDYTVSGEASGTEEAGLTSAADATDGEDDRGSSTGSRSVSSVNSSDVSSQAVLLMVIAGFGFIVCAYSRRRARD